MEVACVSTKLTPFFRTASDSHACHSGARDFPELRVYSPTSLGLVHLGFHFGRVVRGFMEVACVRTRLTPFFRTASDSHACHSCARDFPELRVYSPTPLCLVHLGFHFGRVFRRFVEVACVSTRLTPFFRTAYYSHACHLGARDLPELRVYSPNSLGVMHLGFHFGRVVRGFVEVACVSTTLTTFFPTASDYHACHYSTRDLSQLRVYSPTPLGLVHLAFHFGRVFVRFVEVACVRTRLTPFFRTAFNSHACHSGTRDFPEFRVYSPTLLGLVHLGFHFGRVVRLSWKLHASVQG